MRIIRIEEQKGKKILSQYQRKGMITSSQLREYLGDKPTPVWMTGQNICNLRDIHTNEINNETFEGVMLMIREAVDCGILVENNGVWGLNFEFGDFRDWLHGFMNIRNAIREVTDLYNEEMDK